MRFVCSYSGGKDSVLALYRAMQAGHEPTALLVTCDANHRHSWFHNIPYSLLEKVAKALGIPLLRVETQGECYADDFEQALRQYHSEGVDMCVFGDIDIEEHYDWCHSRCAHIGVESCFPLWGEPRPTLTTAFLEAGFSAMITVVDTSRMNARYVGQVLTPEFIARIASEGVDVSGEQGEYHTFVFDGPLFAKRIHFSVGQPQFMGHHVRVSIGQSINR